MNSKNSNKSISKFSREEMRKLDEVSIKTFNIPGITLMENAGREAFLFLREMLLKKKNSYQEFGDYRHRIK